MEITIKRMLMIGGLMMWCQGMVAASGDKFGFILPSEGDEIVEGEEVNRILENQHVIKTRIALAKPEAFCREYSREYPQLIAWYKKQQHNEQQQSVVPPVFPKQAQKRNLCEEYSKQIKWLGQCYGAVAVGYVGDFVIRSLLL
jgi:hypothetical protein